VLAYYRALGSPRALQRAAPLLFARTEVPSLYLHGEDDGCVGVEMVAGVERAYRAGVDVRVLEGVGHFLHLEAPERVSELVLGFFGAG
jgi:pimeloyl-ACP methyl ester carboxylesterase